MGLTKYGDGELAEKANIYHWQGCKTKQNVYQGMHVLMSWHSCRKLIFILYISYENYEIGV
jgi:hypothetical protein